MKRILLTGSSGHLGSRTLDLLRGRHEVHAVVRKRPAVPADRVIYHEIDLSAPWSVEALPARVDGIVHLAQSRNYREFPHKALEIFHVNVATTAVLLDYGLRAGASHFVLASTGGLYRPGNETIRECTPIDPPRGELSYYFRSKLSAELLADTYGQRMNVSILRPFFIYGPGQASDKLIARLMSSVRDGKPIQIAGEGGLQINPVHVDDVADLLCSLIEAEGFRVLNVAGPQEVSLRHIANEIGRLTEHPPVFAPRGGVAERIVADHRPVQSLLGRPMIRFDDGLRSLFT